MDSTINPTYDAALLMRDALDLLDRVEFVEDAAAEDGILKVIIDGGSHCIRVSVEMLS